MKIARPMVMVLALTLALAACGEKQQPAATNTPTATTASVPPVPADFKPCNTISFADVTTVIGTRPTINSEDVTGTTVPGWASCAYYRANGSPGPTMTVSLQKLPSGPQAAKRHTELMQAISGAQAISGDPDQAYTWTEGNALYIEYVQGWWLTRRSVHGVTDTATHAKLVAATRWPEPRSK